MSWYNNMSDSVKSATESALLDYNLWVKMEPSSGNYTELEALPKKYNFCDFFKSLYFSLLSKNTEKANNVDENVYKKIKKRLRVLYRLSPLYLIPLIIGTLGHMISANRTFKKLKVEQKKYLPRDKFISISNFFKTRDEDISYNTYEHNNRNAEEYFRERTKLLEHEKVKKEYNKLLGKYKEIIKNLSL
ncbi:MAG: hypothetical protein AMS24_01920 [Chlamydiae bacterium SM23_39]|nr:MAG: hypothetical protein AMS24_01920 [Chlamydiae bacterium SM23_39]